VSTYTYAVARRFDSLAITGLRGVDGAAVELVGDEDHEDVVAVVSTLPPAVSSEAALRARLEDLSEVEALARAHDGVVSAVGASTVVVPFRLGTVHHQRRGVVDLLRRRRGEFRALLDRFADRVELGVKVYAAPAVPEAEPPPDARDLPSGANPGRDYLRRRREAVHRREHAWQDAAALAQRVDAALAALADDRRYHRPQDPRVLGGRRENVLNAAYLVETGQAATFAATAKRLGGDNVVVTGPWAPYSFAVADDGGAGNDAGGGDDAGGRV
jgi:hypothetical protein